MDNLEKARDINRALLELEQRAHRNGMTILGHALNRAINVCGWEIAGDLDQAEKAMNGTRA